MLQLISFSKFVKHNLWGCNNTEYYRNRSEILYHVIFVKSLYSLFRTSYYLIFIFICQVEMKGSWLWDVLNNLGVGSISEWLVGTECKFVVVHGLSLDSTKSNWDSTLIYSIWHGLARWKILFWESYKNSQLSNQNSRNGKK